MLGQRDGGWETDETNKVAYYTYNPFTPLFEFWYMIDFSAKIIFVPRHAFESHGGVFFA
jgi:hypothetical protein